MLYWFMLCHKQIPDWKCLNVNDECTVVCMKHDPVQEVGSKQRPEKRLRCRASDMKMSSEQQPNWGTFTHEPEPTMQHDRSVLTWLHRAWKQTQTHTNTQSHASGTPYLGDMWFLSLWQQSSTLPHSLCGWLSTCTGELLCTRHT